MSRPTEPKIRKMRTDLEKIEAKLLKLRAEATTMIGNPRGSDVEVCKQIREAASHIAVMSMESRRARDVLEGPERTLLNRRKK